MTEKYRVEITATAEADVAEIWEYIAQDHPETATGFIRHLEENIETLEQFPERCPNIPENSVLGTAYRHLLFGSYRSIFNISEDRVIILRVLHGSRLLDLGMLEKS